MLYQPLILDNSNWSEFRPKLASYPLRISKLNMIDSKIQVKSISLKYVWSGQENYKLGKKSYSLKDNQFLIANKFSDCNVSIKEKNTSTGICIDLSENYFSDVLYSMYYPNDIDSLNSNISFFLTDECFTQGWNAEGNMQAMLKALMNFAVSNEPIVFKEDYLRDITGELIFHQDKIIREYNKLSTMKLSTRKELFTRLQKAKGIMLEAGTHSLSVREIAHSVCLSEFRFHHLFKKVYSTTPLKFKTQETIKHALRLRETEQLSWTEIADRIGFPDVQTFSKVFKRVFGNSPKQMNCTPKNEIREG